ncbi:protein kinase domain-containing protein [Arthrobacter sp. NPDC055585]
MQMNPARQSVSAGDAGTPPAPVLPEGQWRVGRCLGTGSSSSVWLLENPGEGRRYALKMPLERDSLSEDFELRRELAILSRYHHENLLGVEGVLSTASGPGLLLEYAPGDSLSRLIAARGTLGAGEAVTVLVAVGRALACLHAEGATHGDVAPGNVLFSANGKPLLADFGTGRLLAEPANQATGTPGFMPAGAADPPAEEAGPAADVYALGALGWFMLTGRPLVPGLRPPLSVLLPELPAALRDLVDSALEEDPALRPQAGDFAARVLRTCPAEPVDLLPAVHPAVRPELRTRRSSGSTRNPRRRQRRGKRRFKPPWEEGGRRRAGAAASRAWLTAATLLVGATAVLAAVALAAPQLLRPETAEVIPAAGGTQAPAGASDTAEPPTAASSAPGTPDEPSAEELAVLAGEDPAAAAHVLSELRARAFEQGSVQLLDWVNSPGSPAGSADLEQVRALAERGERLAGLDIEVFRTAAVAEPSGSRARVAVSARLSAWEQVRGDGSTAAQPGGPVRQEVLLELERIGEQWRITAVLPAAASLQERAGTER